jgi:hypothetical protein
VLLEIIAGGIFCPSDTRHTSIKYIIISEIIEKIAGVTKLVLSPGDMSVR